MKTGTLARQRAVRNVQRRLERYYALEAGPDVVAFVEDAPRGGRETLFVRHVAEGLELSLELPPLARARQVLDDAWLQVAEGVSHFVYIVERARRELPATRLELELQAEVDKFVLLVLERGATDARRARRLHGRLYERVYYLHPQGSEDGERYRLANALAARLIARLAARGSALTTRRVLQDFYGSGLADKIHLARAA